MHFLEDLKEGIGKLLTRGLHLHMDEARQVIAASSRSGRKQTPSLAFTSRTT